MATNKNQHYVPRCYLKEFTNNSEGKAINLYNIDRGVCKNLVPVKSQCSGNYFYGKDEKLEGEIQLVERNYSSTLRQLLCFQPDLTETHKSVLRRFWLLQYLRTEASSRRAAEAVNDVGEVTGLSGEEFKLGIKESVQIAMETYTKEVDIVDDLKVCLVRNKTSLPFITSDDPAVLSNRWHLNDKRTKFSSFGLSTAGNLLFLPLTPTLLFLAYDGDVYSIPHKKGLVDISTLGDLKSFNQHQILNCRANLFFKKKENESFVHESFEEVSENRPVARYRTNYAVLDYLEGGHSRYKVVDAKGVEDHEEALIHSETVHCRPTIWPSIMRWRHKGSVYTNGTGRGYVRIQRISPDQEFFYKEPARLKAKLGSRK